MGKKLLVQVLKVGKLCLLMIYLQMNLLNAQPTGTVTMLYTNLGDGSAQFRVDEFGAFNGCSGNGIIFDPLGSFVPKQTDCTTMLYLFDQARTRRVPFSDNNWPFYNSCSGGGTETAPTASNHVMSDMTVGTHTRITQFKVPRFPELMVTLTQVVCGNKLVQTYEFSNVSSSPIDLRMARVGDLGIEYGSTFQKNFADSYPRGSAVPNGAIVLDAFQNVGVAITANPSADAIFEGWRVQVGNPTGMAGHACTWGNYGYGTMSYPGGGGDGLNGFWSNPGPSNATGICGVSATDIPLAPTYAFYHANFFNADMSVIIQSRLSIPAGATKTYITETIAEPGATCCQGPSCGTLSGNVSLDAGGCTQGPPLANRIVVATETTTLLTYYALTDALGNYMINAPFGNYSVTLAIGTSLSPSCPALPNYMLNSSSSSISGIDLLVEDICSADLFITGSSSSTSFPSFCTRPPATPCPGFDYKYCFTILNTGTSTIPASTPFQYDIPFLPINSVSYPATPCVNVVTGPFGSTQATLINPLLSGEQCSFCVEVSIPIGATTSAANPWSSYFGAGTNFVVANCANGSPLLSAVPLDQISSCSCDPNQKSASPIGCGPNHTIAPQDITYTIEFDNIGTGPANRVVVIDELDADLEIGSLRVLETSYPVTDVRIEPIAGQPGRYELHFIFDNINLPPVSIDPTAVGRILYRMRPKIGRPDGTRIENFATIFFDSNPPIQTNTVFHTLRAQPSPAITFPNSDIYIGYGSNCKTLTPTVTGGLAPYTYTWSTGATTPSVQVCPTVATTYGLTVTDAGGCSAASTVTVNIVDARCGNKLDKVLVCHNGHLICVSPNAVPAHLAHGDQVGACPTANKAGEIEVVAPPQLDLQIFPNPATGTTQIRFKLPSDGEASIALYGIDGQMLQNVWKGYATSFSSTSIQLDLQALPAGVYALRLQGVGGQVTRRLIVL